MRLTSDFYLQDALIVGPKLVGKFLVRKFKNGKILKYQITEVEVYRGEEDTACHARFGKTKRSEILYKEGGLAYVYLCYGIHHLFNIVTSKKNDPQAVLIRAVEGFEGPGKLTKVLKINMSFNGLNLTTSKKIWIESDEKDYKYITDKRVGIDYACNHYKNIHWRFILKK